MHSSEKQTQRNGYENSFCVNKNNKCFISDPPIVTLRLGSTLSDNIKEGDDVYFECLAVANPQWRKLYWLHDVSTNFYMLNTFSIFPLFSIVYSLSFCVSLVPFRLHIQYFILSLLLHDFIGRENAWYICAAVSKYYTFNQIKINLCAIASIFVHFGRPPTKKKKEKNGLKKYYCSHKVEGKKTHKINASNNKYSTQSDFSATWLTTKYLLFFYCSRWSRNRIKMPHSVYSK